MSKHSRGRGRESLSSRTYHRPAMLHRPFKSRAYGVKVSHIPGKVTMYELESMFKVYGECSIELGDRSGRALSETDEYYAYVNYYSLANAQNAVDNEHGKEISGGGRLTVKLQGSGATTKPTIASPSQSTVKVTNISKQVTESNLTEIFSFSNRVELASVKLNRTSSHFNFAYVNYLSYDDAERAVAELNGCRTVDGSILQVKLHGSQSQATPQGVSGALVQGSVLNSPTSSSCSLKVMISSGSPNADDLLECFSHFGELCEKPIIRQGSPNFAYINFKHEHYAKTASQYPIIEIKPGVTVKVRLSEKTAAITNSSSMPSSAVTRRPSAPLAVSRHISCNMLTSRMLTSHDPKYVQYRQSIAPVSLTIAKNGTGVVLFGEEARLPAAESLVDVLIKDAQRDLSQKMLPLPCMYIPAFSNPSMVSSLTEIEQKCSVEFLACTSFQCVQDVASFSKTVSSKLEGQTPAEISCLDTVLQHKEPSDLLPCDTSLTQPANYLVWSWEDEVGGYTHYDPVSNAKLSEQFASSPQGPFELTIATRLGRTGYRIDFTAMIQTNLNTKNQRKIISESCHVKWLYKDDTKKYVPYSLPVCLEIEKMSIAKVPHCLTINGRTYTFDFTRMRQINISTLYERKIKRQPPTGNPSTGNSPTSKSFVLKVSGLQQSIQDAETSLKDELGKALVKRTHRLPSTANSTFQAELIQTLQKYFVWPQIVDNSIQVHGIQGYIEKVMLIVREKILDHEKDVLTRQVSTSHGASIPSHWEPQSEKISIKKVQRGSSEWNEVERKVHETMPNAQFTSVDRIQNQWLWDRYSFARDRMSERNNGKVNEKELFHGTRTTAPEKVFKSEQGFDFRYSSKGLWGTGTYFAVNASYSDNYSYSSGSDKQMILASVLTGDTYRCRSDGSLKKPPIKPRTSASTTFEDERYDSVSGHTNGSDVFIIYDHEKAYPDYLITYTTRGMNLY